MRSGKWEVRIEDVKQRIDFNILLFPIERNFWGGYLVEATW